MLLTEWLLQELGVKLGVAEFELEVLGLLEPVLVGQVEEDREGEEDWDTLVPPPGVAVERFSHEKVGGLEGVGDTVDVAVSPPAKSSGVPVCEVLTVGVVPPTPFEAVAPPPPMPTPPGV